MDSRLNKIKEQADNFKPEPREGLWSSIFEEIKDDNVVKFPTWVSIIKGAFVLGLLILATFLINGVYKNEEVSSQFSNAISHSKSDNKRTKTVPEGNNQLFGSKQSMSLVDSDNKENNSKHSVEENLLVGKPHATTSNYNYLKKSSFPTNKSGSTTPISKSINTNNQSSRNEGSTADILGLNINKKSIDQENVIPRRLVNEISLLDVLDDSYVKDNKNYNDLNIQIKEFRTKRFSISGYLGAEQLVYCRNHKATNVNRGIQVNYKIGRKWSINLGLRVNSLNYQFDFTEDMKKLYRSTDKYPEVYSLYRDIQMISNQNDFISSYAGFDFVILSHIRHELTIGLNQELILHQQQKLSYDFGESVDFIVERSNKKITTGRTEPNLKYSYRLSNQFKIGLQANYVYYQDFIGHEKERYSGIGLNIFANYKLF